MIDAGRAPQRIGGLTVFFDHADDDRRYVFAEVPRLIVDPEPQLSLLLFRGDRNRGGLLQMASVLAPTDEELEATEGELRATGRMTSLARPVWRSGTVRVAGWLEAEALAPLVLSVGSPSLIGDPEAVIAARLDEAGAALADAALRGNALPTVVIFELETLGLSGPLGIEAEADLQAMHDRLTAEGALTTPYGRARIAKTWEEFERDNLIRIRVIDESGDVESRRAEAMRRIGQDLVATMFSPFPPPERPQQLDDGTVAPLELSFRLTMRREELATTSRWSFRERRAVPIRHYAAASLIQLLGERAASDHIGIADLTEETGEIVVRVEPELENLAIAAVEIDLRPSADDEPSHTVTLTPELPEQRLAVAHRPTSPLLYRVRARFDPEKTSADDRESPWLETSGTLIVVSARRLFPPRMITVIAGRVEFDWLDHVEVAIEAPGEPQRSLVLNGDMRSRDAFFPGIESRSLMMTTHWRGLPGEPSRSDPPAAIDGDIVVLDSPFGDSIEVMVVPLPISTVVEIVVELRSENDGFQHTRTLSWDATDRTPKRAGLRRLVGSPRHYSHHIVLIHQDGMIEDNDWTVSEDSTLVIGADQPVVVHQTEIVLLGGGPAERGSMAVELVLETGGSRARKVLENDDDHAELVLVCPEDASPTVLVAREFLKTGVVRETRWEDPESLVVVPPAPIENPEP
jgi:hypothetical protein